MPLSRLAREFAAEIAYHDWSDAPFRRDRAGHRREHDSKCGVQQLNDVETENVRLNVMWTAGQVLGHADLLAFDDGYEWAAACGCTITTPAGRDRSGHIPYGFRMDVDRVTGEKSFAPPGPPAPVGRLPMDPGPWDEDDLVPEGGQLIEFARALEALEHWSECRGIRGHNDQLAERLLADIERGKVGTIQRSGHIVRVNDLRLWYLRQAARRSG